MAIYNQDVLKEEGMDPSSPTLSSTHSPFSVASPVPEDVTTIFVVGFPDDMQEREFQNMFLFSKGFEGASLKWHCKQDEESNENNKKQMIGFARFTTRSEAMEAVDILNGRKVDVEKSSVLKAEMAKKNLHIKKGTNSSATLPGSSNTTINNTTTTATTTTTTTTSATSPMTILTRNLSQKSHKLTGINNNYEPFSPIPSDLLSPIHDPFFRGSDIFNDARSQSFDARSQQIPTGNIQPYHPHPHHHQQQQQQQQQPFHLFSKSTFMDPDSDPFHYLSKSLPMSNFDSATIDNKLLGDDYASIMNRKNSFQPTTTTSLSRLSTATMDQNPPCNTLYVGNLPLSTNQEELRSLFSKCEGYKRMCFRIKSPQQGPMCFVEFEDVLYATQAMTKLQGYMLSNSVKSGIRLSFSKNPLFIKPKDNSDVNFNFREMGAALLADL
ncbi:hypothetical protein BCV72DRAFT_284350 [Rhizopus microsporus var. microsporus]|uniref:RRM domain-containing protein n=2 Tax=Rhizopus microsporus TaxID=58291 RepID=A0A2G4SU19_RHIZD|nr:uncharacterized protein RHIMIDRAFT_313707 [Rhizopus microsporus ATCC 52813]ORE11353.1 hypothetical protein BCV72DRAFT_284350 [Rhizopus microsporus var. microsporus]PHZ12242.1 hypothetical protein RHIMIDRAFT_313707 [Rhizopus microsporus ATCC 52813]